MNIGIDSQTMGKGDPPKMTVPSDAVAVTDLVSKIDLQPWNPYYT